MNKSIYIPSGEIGSINYLTKIMVDEPFDIAIVHLPKEKEVWLNVLSNLNKQAGPEVAFELSKKMLKLNWEL